MMTMSKYRKGDPMNQVHTFNDSSSRPIECGDPGENLCNWSDWRNNWSTKVNTITNKFTISSLLWAVSADVTGLTTLVASFASSVEGTSVRRSAVY